MITMELAVSVLIDGINREWRASRRAFLQLVSKAETIDDVYQVYEANKGWLDEEDWIAFSKLKKRKSNNNNKKPQYKNQPKKEKPHKDTSQT